MASCAVCVTTRSVLLTSSCRVLNSRSIPNTTHATASASVTAIQSASTALKVCGGHQQRQLHLLPIASTVPSLTSSTSTTTAASCGSSSANQNGLNNWHILSTAAALLAAATITTTSPSISSCESSSQFVSKSTAESGGEGGAGSGDGAGMPVDRGVANVATTSSSSKKKADDVMRAYEEYISENSYQVSKSSEQGVRWTMEDTFTVGNGGHFAAVFDGHGGAGVSGMLRDHVFRLYSKALTQRHSEEAHKSELEKMEVDDDDVDESNNEPITQHLDGIDQSSTSIFPSIKSHVDAIRGALSRVERESLRHDHFEYQGSTAVVVLVHNDGDGKRTLISANVGDSRAILCRGKKAIDLTKDHKPSDPKEKARIRSMGEDVQWDPYGEIYRVKDLSLSRAIGDRFAKPVVSSEAEIDSLPINNDEDEFFLLASDGLWDVMTSQEVVDFVHEMLACPTQSVKTKKGKITLTPEFRKRKMARFVAHEALERGSADNVCVIIVWLQRDAK